MKRCRSCCLDYPISHTVCPAHGTRLEELESSFAVSPVIEIHSSASPPPGGAEEKQRTRERTLLEDLHAFLEEERLHKLYFELGPNGVEVQLSHAAVSLGLFSLGIVATGVGVLALLSDLPSFSSMRWWPDMVFAIGLAGLIAPRPGFSRAGGLVLAGIALLAHTLDVVSVSVWPLLTVACGGFVLLHRRRVRVSGMTLRFVY